MDATDTVEGQPSTDAEWMAAALACLVELDEGQGVALPRLAKRLSLRVSVLLRLYAQLSEASIGGQAGPGWVALRCDTAGRWRASTTSAGRDALTNLGLNPPTVGNEKNHEHGR